MLRKTVLCIDSWICIIGVGRATILNIEYVFWLVDKTWRQITKAYDWFSVIDRPIYLERERLSKL